MAANITLGGSNVRFCHWLYGARLATPVGLMLESRPIGRGIVQLLKGLKARPCCSVVGLKCMLVFPVAPERNLRL